ncbi:sensor histidine kinase [Noviherbaspirillum massiliense]|uniref:sensor histidine kinase n=1 Tax=Noviherbaspirillum massiliense TaxID=1465823 RepID=UPI000364681A|nr:sensor histidine kinase [Noviherbaspirillum massiliense]
MKQRRWASSNRTGCIACLLKLLLLFFAYPAVLASAANVQQVIRIEQAEFVISNAQSIPGNDAGWQKVVLPHRSPKPKERDLVPYWYRASFHLGMTDQPLWAYFPKLRSGGVIYLNGIRIGEIRGADEVDQVRWFRPYLRYLPPIALREGRNEIAVHFAIREPLTSFGEFVVGPETTLRGDYEQMLFWEETSTKIASAVCLFVGTLILIFWLRRRQERLYGIFGICVLFWGIRTFVFRMPVVPMEHWVFWRVCYYFTTAGFIVCITIFLLHFSGFIRPLLNRFLLAYWLIGCLLFALIGIPARAVMDTWWTLGFLPFTLFAFLRLAHYAVCQRTASSIAMVLAILFALSLALHDYAVQVGMFGLQEFYLLHLGIPAYLLVMGCVLLNRFYDSLVLVESANERLMLRLAEREKELAASYEQLRKLELDRATTEERQRIMQDMHDGVGSQLLSTLALAESGTVTHKDMVSLLRECLDDMRLAIDSLTPADPDLLPVLGDLRRRMETRFSALGVTLHWRNQDLPDSLEVGPRAGLQLLRILQEALTNVLKHAQAKNVDVDILFEADQLVIRIADDGVGFSRAGKHNGHGVANMKMRAERIGAAFIIEDSGKGTVIRLDLPLPAISAATH